MYVQQTPVLVRLRHSRELPTNHAPSHTHTTTHNAPTMRPLCAFPSHLMMGMMFNGRQVKCRPSHSLSLSLSVSNNDRARHELFKASRVKYSHPEGCRVELLLEVRLQYGAPPEQLGADGQRCLCNINARIL